jgi:triosephosphate isomerase
MKIKLPVIVVNYKTYAESTGERGLELSQNIQGVSKDIVLVPQTPDLRLIASKVNNPVLAQHIDPVSQGAHTGHINAETVKGAGAIGTLINHSEKQLYLPEIQRCVEICKETKLISLVCVAEMDTEKAVAAMGPDMIAIEPPELIGSGIPVSKAKPGIVRDAVRLAEDINPDVKVLCGAGITNGDDVRKAIELGAEGVLVASGIVKAKNPAAVVRDMYDNL